MAPFSAAFSLGRGTRADDNGPGITYLYHVQTASLASRLLSRFPSRPLAALAPFTDLVADLTAYDTAALSQADDRVSGVQDTAIARQALAQGRAAVLNKHRRQPELIAAWKTASRVDRPDAKTAAPTPAPVTPPAS